MWNTWLLVCFLLSLIPNPTLGIPLANGVTGDPKITCGPTAITVDFNTQNTFEGNVYVKGLFLSDQCRRVAATSITLPFESCNVRRTRSLNPKGVFVSTTVIISFHPQFITKVDRAYRIQCFYMEADKTVSTAIDVSMLTTQFFTQNMAMPICRYQVLTGGPTGAPVSYAVVGDKVYHSWKCDTETTDTFCMRVHSCYVDDSRGEGRVDLIDAEGCTRDIHLLNTPEYAGELMAGIEAHVFKYADKAQLYFQCQISIMIKEPGLPCLPPPSCVTAAGAEVRLTNAEVLKEESLSKETFNREEKEFQPSTATMSPSTKTTPVTSPTTTIKSTTTVSKSTTTMTPSTKTASSTTTTIKSTTTVSKSTTTTPTTSTTFTSTAKPKTIMVFTTKPEKQTTTTLKPTNTISANTSVRPTTVIAKTITLKPTTATILQTNPTANNSATSSKSIITITDTSKATTSMAKTEAPTIIQMEEGSGEASEDEEPIISIQKNRRVVDFRRKFPINPRPDALPNANTISFKLVEPPKLERRKDPPPPAVESGRFGGLHADDTAPLIIFRNKRSEDASVIGTTDVFTQFDALEINDGAPRDISRLVHERQTPVQNPTKNPAICVNYATAIAVGLGFLVLYTAIVVVYVWRRRIGKHSQLQY